MDGEPVNDMSELEFENLRAPVEVKKINNPPARMIRRKVKVRNQVIDALFHPKYPTVKTIKTLAAAGEQTGAITTQELKQRYPRYFIHRPINYDNVREMTDPYNNYTRRLFTDCARSDPTAAPALRKRNNAFFRNGFNLRLRPKAKRNAMTGSPMTPEEIEMESMVWNQQYASYLSILDEWSTSPRIKLLQKIKAAHYVGTVQGRALTKHFPPLSLLEEGVLPETIKVISAEEMGNVLIDRMTEDIVAIRIFSVDEENFTLLPDEFVYMPLNDSALTRYERFYGRSDMETVVQLSRINKHIVNVGYAKAFEAAYLPKVLAQLPVEGSPQQKMDQLQNFAQYMAGAKDVITIEQSEYGSIQAYPQDVKHEMVVAIRKDLDEIVLGALGSTKAQISRTENLTRDNATIMEIENRRNVIIPDEETYAQAFEEQLLNPLFAHITGIPVEHLPVEVYIEAIPDEENVLEDLDEKRADPGAKSPGERSEDLDGEKSEDIESGTLEQRDHVSDMGAAGFDESKHKRDDAGKFSKKEGGGKGPLSQTGLIRKKDKRNLPQSPKDDSWTISDKEIERVFDRQRYKVEYKDKFGNNIVSKTALRYSRIIADVLNEVPDSEMTHVRKLVIKNEFEKDGMTGWYNFVSDEIGFNVAEMSRYVRDEGVMVEYIRSVVAHELAHKDFKHWPIEKLQRWKERIDDMEDINDYTESFRERDEKARQNELRKGPKSFSRYSDRVRIPLQEALRSEDPNQIYLYRPQIEKLKKRWGLTSDEQMIDGTWDTKFEKAKWMSQNIRINEMHSAMMESLNGFRYAKRWRKFFNEGALNRLHKVYVKEFKDG